MDVKSYTDKNYIPFSQLQTLGEDFLIKIDEYRKSFIQAIEVGKLDYANIIETPDLIKKRFIKNVEVAKKVKFPVDDGDYIMMLAKLFVTNSKSKYVEITDNKELLSMYEANKKDLTIITTYIEKNIWDEKVIKWKQATKPTNDLKMILPQLSRHERSFAEKYHQIKHHYTLSDFQELNKTSYETARKSMEKLRKLKLYLKSKVGKKHVYEPTDKLQDALKGGVTWI